MGTLGGPIAKQEKDICDPISRECSGLTITVPSKGEIFKGLKKKEAALLYFMGNIKAYGGIYEFGRFLKGIHLFKKK